MRPRLGIVQTRQLEYLVTVARTGHFRRAAELCNVSQPSLSEAIRKLEQELGVTLIERDRRFIGLTPEGERVVQLAERVLEATQALHDEVSLMRAELAGTLDIGVIATAVMRIPGITAPFQEIHPRVRINMRANMVADEIHQGLLGFGLDVGISYLDMLPDGLVGRPLYRERYVLLVKQGTVPEGWLEHGATPREVAGLPLVAFSRRSQARRILDRQFRDQGAEIEPRIEVDSLSSISAHVQMSGWAGLLPSSWAHGLAEHDGLVTVELLVPDPPHIGLITRADEVGRPIAQAFIAAALRTSRS